MAYTRHGHHIPGSDEDTSINRPITPCGGPRMCEPCEAEVTRFKEYYPDKVEVPLVKPSKVTHSLGLNVMVGSEEDWNKAYMALTRMSMKMGRLYPSVNVSSYLLDEEPGVDEQTEYYDEKTILKVRYAITEALQNANIASAGVNDILVVSIIEHLEKAGILFRERP